MASCKRPALLIISDISRPEHQQNRRNTTTNGVGINFGPKSPRLSTVPQKLPTFVSSLVKYVLFLALALTHLNVGFSSCIKFGDIPAAPVLRRTCSDRWTYKGLDADYQQWRYQ